MKRRIVPIVEGFSEAESIPAFLRRVLQDRGVFHVEPDRAIREHRQRLVKKEIFVNRVRMAQLREDCSAVLVLFDADDDAACELGPSLRKFSEDEGIAVPTCVVIAVREIESWLIAGAESLRDYRGISCDLSPPDPAESIRGAKERLDRHMQSGYKETIDQLPLLLKFDYAAARKLAPSLDKFLRDVEGLIQEAAIPT